MSNQCVTFNPSYRDVRWIEWWWLMIDKDVFGRWALKCGCIEDEATRESLLKDIEMVGWAMKQRSPLWCRQPIA